MFPLIKWTGAKRHIAPQIISKFPDKIEIYYEPFLGGGSVFLELLQSNKEVKHYRLSDINAPLIDIFKIVKENPVELISRYNSQWLEFQKDSAFYYKQRELFNQTKDPFIFYFLTRTSYKGTVRFNQKGGFNVSHHFGRPGMHPDKVAKIIMDYHSLMVGKDIEFSCISFENVYPENFKDVVFCDPPYTNTKSLYQGNIELEKLFSWLSGLKCPWFMTLNGINAKDNEETLPIGYSGKELLKSGNSSFSRLKKKMVEVEEYYYWKIT